MAAKFILAIICVLLGATSMVLASGHGGFPYAIPRYNYQYAVNDPITGDFKQVRELRDGPYTVGGYSLVQPFSGRQVNYEILGR
ncbi:unnamed protein product [Allacma fusca]|uniref:Uncharacterized protein n=1 Tax=Allacma fusca TaxID=39272 RepID=A0A8J2PD30_9HEXA|nr:unnamed protein product [Allacma fusca]